MSRAAVIPPPPDEPPTLVFQWRRAGSRLRLGLMIFLALLGHAASFYVLQVAYTPTGSLLPPPARVVLVPLDRPENASLAHWLSLSDPTLTTQAALPAADAVVDSLGLRYVPSYEVAPPGFKSLETAPAVEVIAAPPRPIPPGLVPMIEPASVKTSPAAGAWNTHTRVVFDGGLGAFAPVPLPSVEWNGGTNVKPLEPTVFLVGIRAQGGTPFLFPARRAPAPTNNPGANADEADECAREYLARLTFRPSGVPDGGTLWGRATFYWGNEPHP